MSTLVIFYKDEVENGGEDSIIVPRPLVSMPNTCSPVDREFGRRVEAGSPGSPCIYCDVTTRNVGPEPLIVVKPSESDVAMDLPPEQFYKFVLVKSDCYGNLRGIVR